MDEERYRILLVDDHPLFRRGVAQLLATQQDFEVVGEATSGEEGVVLARSLQPDLVLMDVDMRGQGGLQALKQIKESGLDAQVIMQLFGEIRAAREDAQYWRHRAEKFEGLLELARKTT